MGGNYPCTANVGSNENLNAKEQMDSDVRNTSPSIRWRGQTRLCTITSPPSSTKHKTTMEQAVATVGQRISRMKAIIVVFFSHQKSGIRQGRFARLGARNMTFNNLDDWLALSSFFQNPFIDLSYLLESTSKYNAPRRLCCTQLSTWTLSAALYCHTNGRIVTLNHVKVTPLRTESRKAVPVQGFVFLKIATRDLQIRASFNITQTHAVPVLLRTLFRDMCTHGIFPTAKWYHTTLPFGDNLM